MTAVQTDSEIDQHRPYPAVPDLSDRPVMEWERCMVCHSNLWGVGDPHMAVRTDSMIGTPHSLGVVHWEHLITQAEGDAIYAQPASKKKRKTS